MIFLKSIYSEPEGLFDKVEFHDGINVIYGKYSTKGQKKDSLNSIGKTTLVHLINFCLLSSFDKRSRLFKAKQFLDDYYIVLEIEINGKFYTIKRTTSKANQILFGENILEKYSLNQLKKILCEMFFYNSSYDGTFSTKWFRQLIPLFIRDEKNGFNKDPIMYIENCSYLQMVPYNLFLMGINNTLALKNYELRTDLKNKQDFQTEIKKIINETYGVKEIQDSTVIIQSIQDEITELEKAIGNYELNKSYFETEKELNEVTSTIKNFVLANYSIQKKLESYKANLEYNTQISTNKVARLYKEIDEQLGIKVKKVLDEAIAFKKRLVESRRLFLNSEIKQLEDVLNNNKLLINELDEQRSRLFNFLDEKEAIKDLTGAFEKLNEKRELQNELNSRVKVFNDIQNEILEIKQQEASLESQIYNFINSIQNSINKIRKVFNEIYNSLYTTDEGIFNIAYVDGKQDAKTEIKATTFDSSGWGKGRANILIYDLTILIHSIKMKYNFPRFLIHDGIFNGVHKSQFIATMNYLNALSKEVRFQYIFTANESDIWIKEDKENAYGKLDVDLDAITIAEFNETNKIFKRNF